MDKARDECPGLIPRNIRYSLNESGNTSKEIVRPRREVAISRLSSFADDPVTNMEQFSVSCSLRMKRSHSGAF